MTVYKPLHHSLTWLAFAAFTATPAALAVYVSLDHRRGLALGLLLLAALGFKMTLAVSSRVSESRVHPGPLPVPRWIPWAALILLAGIPAALALGNLYNHQVLGFVALSLVSAAGTVASFAIARLRYDSLTRYYKASGQL